LVLTEEELIGSGIHTLLVTVLFYRDKEVVWWVVEMAP
jgi:hypothetical protein